MSGASPDLERRVARQRETGEPLGLHVAYGGMGRSLPGGRCGLFVRRGYGEKASAPELVE